ncbi:MAG: type I methionyl aminopeptidase [Bacteroidetes bacterium]|nr:type I methionyl aminopeptidase [Bacteroidota bacterium]
MAIVIKNAGQIEGIRKSSRLAAETLKYLEPFVKPGIKTIELDKLAEDFVRSHGAQPATKGYKGYKHSTCISPNDVICHGVPNDYVLEFGDIVNIDVTTILNGFYGDTCRMYFVGEVSDYAKKICQVAKECLHKGMEQCFPGNHLGNIGYHISEYAHRHGYSVVYEFCGHGVGIKFHEDPEVAHIAEKNTGPILKPGMTFTIEPMINAGKARAKVDRKDGWTARTIDGKLSAQYEHTILITDTGYEALTDVYGDF